MPIYRSKPDTVLSGQGMVSRTSVNLRYGANSQCPLAGSVGKNEVFTLFGDKDKLVLYPNSANPDFLGLCAAGQWSLMQTVS